MMARTVRFLSIFTIHRELGLVQCIYLYDLSCGLILIRSELSWLQCNIYSCECAVHMYIVQ
jgi:hypothetical protein